VNGVTYDGKSVWIATGTALQSISPSTGALERSIAVPAMAGSAFDGRYLYQLADGVIQKLERDSGQVVARIPAPCENVSGMAWAEGFLWIGQYRACKIHQLDPETGKIIRTLESDRMVTGVTWVDGELWHGAVTETQTELRQVDPQTGAVQRRLSLADGLFVSGLESDGDELLYCGGGASGKLRAVRRRSRRRT
jgi:glutamine cyclotransferase